MYIKSIFLPNRNWPVLFTKNRYFGIFSLAPLCRDGNIQFRCHIFCKFFLGTFSLFIFFVAFHSTNIMYVILLLSCTIFQFRFVCSVLLLFWCTDKNTPRLLQRQWKRWQPPLTAICCTSIDNGGDTGLAPATVGPSVPSRPVPSRPVPSRPIQLVTSQFIPLYQPAH